MISRRAALTLVLSAPLLPGYEDWSSMKQRSITLDYEGIEEFEIKIGKRSYVVPIEEISAALARRENR